MLKNLNIKIKIKLIIRLILTEITFGEVLIKIKNFKYLCKNRIVYVIIKNMK